MNLADFPPRRRAFLAESFRSRESDRGATNLTEPGYTPGPDFTGLISGRAATTRTRGDVMGFEIQTRIMKDDFSFKLLSAVIVAGVILAFVNPGSSARPPNGSAASTVNPTAAK